MQREETAMVHEGRNVKRIREMLGVKQEALKVANALKVPSEAIKNFNEENFINIVQNNYDGSSNNYSGNYYCTFNPLEKFVEQVEENKRLYEALLKSEREKIALLEQLLNEKK